jgi:hypothetical protein
MSKPLTINAVLASTAPSPVRRVQEVLDGLAPDVLLLNADLAESAGISRATLNTHATNPALANYRVMHKYTTEGSATKAVFWGSRSTIKKLKAKLGKQ